MAQRLGYAFLDTGAMYRAATWLVLQRGIDPADNEQVLQAVQSMRIDVRPGQPGEDSVTRVCIDDVDVTPYLRSPEVERIVSAVSSIRRLRRVLIEVQREVARQGPIVMAGRDIGTVVLPEAPLKIFLDASLEERARRRWRELVQKGEMVSLEQVRAELRRRDALDSRTTPFQPAPGTIVVHTDNLSLDQVVEEVLKHVPCRS